VNSGPYPPIILTSNNKITVLGGLLATIVFETSHAKSLTFAFFAQNSKHLHHFFE
jgi:hypothetical protein